MYEQAMDLRLKDETDREEILAEGASWTDAEMDSVRRCVFREARPPVRSACHNPPEGVGVEAEDTTYDCASHDSNDQSLKSL